LHGGCPDIRLFFVVCQEAVHYNERG
jgi:hypothetical protein